MERSYEVAKDWLEWGINPARKAAALPDAVPAGQLHTLNIQEGVLDGYKRIAIPVAVMILFVLYGLY